MKVNDLTRDPALLPASLKGLERSLRGGYVNMRVRAMLRADPTLHDPAVPADILDAKVPQLRTQLQSEFPKAATAYETVRQRVATDTQSGKLLPLDGADGVDRRIRARYLQRLGMIPQRIRDRLVLTGVWWAVGADVSLLDPARIDALHLLIDRRMHLVERMLYHVGRANRRDWNTKQIKQHPEGPWRDGWRRMFEYPRVPLGLFGPLCNPAPGDEPRTCQQPGMQDWWQSGVENLHHAIQVNATSRNSWKPPVPPDPDGYILYFQKGAPGPAGNPATAIQQLFTPSDDYRQRNLLYCDHVIQCLHLEALLFARTKRDPDTSWLTTLVSTNGAGWLRIDVSWGYAAAPPYLVSPKEPKFFEQVQLHSSELQVGDHVIVYNHPAYDKATVGGVWRLENAVVVQVYPTLLMQGHGTNPETLEQMKHDMIGLFNAELNRLRTKVQGHVKPDGSEASVLSIGTEASGVLVRRVTPAASAYAQGPTRVADWWLMWELDPEKGEQDVAANPAWRALVEAQHRVSYGTLTKANGAVIGVGFFPLWEPRKKGGVVVTNSAGKITAIQKIVVGPEMVSAWDWFYPEDASAKSILWAIRPKP